MTCRIDRVHSPAGLVLRISGRIAPEDMEVVRTALREAIVGIELSEIELVDRGAVRLLAAAEAGGIELRRCPAYIREWITREGDLNQGEAP